MAIKLKLQETGSTRLKVGSTDGLKFKAEQGIPIYPEYYTGDYEVTPTESEQSLEAHGLMMSDDVTVHAIAGDYVGSEVTRRSSTDLTASGATVTVPSGFYEENASKDIPTGTVVPPVVISSSTSTLTAEDNVLTLYKKVNVAPYVSEAGYISQGTKGDIDITLKHAVPTRSSADLTASGATVTAPSGYYAESASKSVASGTEGTPTATKGTVSNHAISVTPSVTNSAGYISGGTHNGTAVSVSASELVSGTLNVSSSGTKDVTNYASASIPSGTAGTPSASKGTVSDHSVSVTPSVTNSTGWITGSTKTGTAVSVSASELVSGTKSITANGTNIDVTNYASVDVSVSGSAPILETVTKTYTPTTSQQTDTITPSTGYDGIEEVDVTINAVATGTAGTPSASKGTVSNHSVSVTPSVTNTTGYITGGTKTGTAVTVSASELVSGSKTISASGNTDVTNYATASVASGSATASASKGTVSNHSVTVTPSVTRTAGYITAGSANGTAVTVSASELVSGSETKTANGTYDVTNLAELVVNVSGGTSKNTQVVQGTTRTTKSAMTAIGDELTVSKTGTYDIYWSGFRSSTSTSYTYATQLYIDGAAHGSENSTWSNNIQNNHLESVSLTVNQKLRVYGRNSRNSSYYIYAPTLVIVEN